MSESGAGEAIAELNTVRQALSQARTYVAGHDQSDTARQLADQLRHSPLRTLLEQGEAAAERVAIYLRAQTRK